MRNNTLEAFKKAIKEKYEVEKWIVNSHFLLQPSRAKLRDLCFELFKENSNEADLMCFKAFFGFEFSPNHFNKLKALTDKFRPLETFLKGETDLNDLAGVNMAAVLVDFTPRPYLKFSRAAVLSSNETNSTETKTVQNQLITNEIVKDSPTNVIFSQKTPPPKSFFFRNPLLLILPLLVCSIGFYGYKMHHQKKCMQWSNDHYETVSCKTEQLGILQETDKIPVNEQLLQLRKITVSDTTVFFKNEKPQIWYCKKNKKVEFFNGPGFHPESGKALKPITNYMIKKYVLNKEKISK